MSKYIKLLSIVLVLFTLGCVSNQGGLSDSDSEDKPNMLARYQKAEMLLPDNLRHLVDNLYVTPNWLPDGGFWYRLDNNGSAKYWRYHPQQGVSELFDFNALKIALGEASDTLKINDIQIIDFEASELTLRLSDEQWLCILDTQYRCEQTQSESSENAPLTSPDQQWQMLVKDHNLVLRNLVTGEDSPLTTDGTEDNAYATESANPKVYFNETPGTVEPHKVGYWSADSRYFVTFQMDLRNVGKLHLTQSVTGEDQRPRLYSYHYPMAGDEHLIEAQVVMVDVAAKKVERVPGEPLLQTYYGTPLWGEFSSNNKYYFLQRERGYHVYHLIEYDPATGQLRTILTEENDKFIDPWIQDFRILAEQDLLLWTSERGGIQQLFRYQLSSGKLLNAITPDTMFMRAIRAIDTDNEVLYFEGSGAQPGDSYYRYLYRVQMDGTGLTLLTPEIQMHDTRVAPDFRTFLDSTSTVQQPTKHLVRSTVDGTVLTTIHETDNRALLAAGYREPEPFTVLAEDGKTHLHGILYFPSDFDANKSYPVLDDIYTGPHGYFTPKTYDGPLYAHANALAELGFIVLKMDGRGTAKRNRKFHEYSYDNLAGGADDHVWALKQLAKERPYMDIQRVGIFGFSAGGYDTVQAMYKYPEVFKAGVSASGNHDFRADKAGWNETWMGYPVEAHWDQQSNLTDVGRLQGKLLLAHGELDENVHPAATLQLVDKLIKANKDFDLLLYPNMGHVLHYHPHFVRTRWDFFVEHLLAEEVPQSYQITSLEIPELAK